jgi:hypothetical protein
MMKRVGYLSIFLIAFFATGRSSADDGPANPFAGWDEERIEKHRKKSASAVKSRLGKWLKARKGMSEKCRKCRGKGKVKSGRTLQPCLNCRGTGVRIDRKKFERAFWEFLSPSYRGDNRRRLAMNQRYSAAKQDPETATAELQEITGGKAGDVEVKGNFAVATFQESLGRERFKRRMEWIEIDGDWWMADPVADKKFARIPYSGPVAKPSGKSGTAKTDPGKRPEAGTGAGGKPDGTKATTERKPLEDPENIFRMGDVTVRHVEENAYKVFGQVTNKTEKRRFAYIIVEVSFFKGDKMIDTVTCNVGTVILKPGRTASFVGYLYSDAKPKYDRIEPKVAKYEEMD